MNAEELRRRADAVSWWHGGMNLGQGVVTHGRVTPSQSLLPLLDLPDVTGKSVLDIGAWDGYMSWECERRGAAKVVAVDSFEWDLETSKWAVPNGNGTGRAGFDLCHEVYNSKVIPVVCEVIDLAPEQVGGTFDVVLFLGVLYHLRHPLLALERVASVVGDLLIVETHTAMNDTTTPAMRFYPGSELNNDKTNWWGPNVACVSSMLHDVGFTEVTHVSQRHDRAVFHARR
jgi:tRNA (mo5U34)-methyltransferase